VGSLSFTENLHLYQQPLSTDNQGDEEWGNLYQTTMPRNPPLILYNQQVFGAVLQGKKL
jgi:hypothetical protein